MSEKEFSRESVDMIYENAKRISYNQGFLDGYNRGVEDAKEMAQLREMKSCDYKNCSKKGGIYIGNFMDYSNDWLADREPTEPTVPVFVCEKHAKKIFKLLDINKGVL